MPNLGQEDRHDPDNGIGDRCDDPDGDGFVDWIEMYLPTDPDDKCPDNPSDAAHPLDMNNNGVINVTDANTAYKGQIPAAVDSPAKQRKDLDRNGVLNVADANKYKGKIPSASCA